MIFYMEAAFKVIGNLSDVRNKSHVVSIIFVSHKVKVDLLSEEKFHKEIHKFLVFFKFKVVVTKHAHTSSHHYFAVRLRVLIHCTYGSVARISKWP